MIEYLNTLGIGDIKSFTPEDDSVLVLSLLNETLVTFKLTFYSTGELYSLYSEDLIEIPDHFLCCDFTLKEVSFPNTTHVGNYFLLQNNVIEKIHLPNVEIIYPGFLEYNNSLKVLLLPKTTHIYSGFLNNNQVLENLDLPNLFMYMDPFLEKNNIIDKNRFEKNSDSYWFKYFNL
jgi:hypothetical protein